MKSHGILQRSERHALLFIRFSAVMRNFELAGDGQAPESPGNAHDAAGAAGGGGGGGGASGVVASSLVSSDVCRQKPLKYRLHTRQQTARPHHCVCHMTSHKQSAAQGTVVVKTARKLLLNMGTYFIFSLVGTWSLGEARPKLTWREEPVTWSRRGAMGEVGPEEKAVCARTGVEGALLAAAGVSALAGTGMAVRPVGVTGSLGGLAGGPGSAALRGSAAGLSGDASGSSNLRGHHTGDVKILRSTFQSDLLIMLFVQSPRMLSILNIFFLKSAD